MWRRFTITKNNIKAETGKAVLIACPHHSEYDGYCFWHPSKLVREDRNGWTHSISYTEEFTFNLKKYGKGKYNSRKVLDEVQLGYDEIEEIYGVMSNAYQKKNPYETHKPEAVEAVKTEADESLIDNE